MKASGSAPADLFGQACEAPHLGLDAFIGGLDVSWREQVLKWRSSEPAVALLAFLEQRRLAGARIYPPQPLRALALTPLPSVRVVILGQDPYHGAGQADGLAFSVADGLRWPPSLRNILKEVERDLGPLPARAGVLEGWARKGVLLLNTVLTVEDGLPGSHAGRGWESLTDLLVSAVAQKPEPVAFLLWGARAQVKAALIERVAPDRHVLLAANHPSPLSALRPPLPFIGCGHFSETMRRIPGFSWFDPPAAPIDAFASPVWPSPPSML